MAQEAPWLMVEMPIEREPAWHLADAGTLRRRAPSYQFPPGAMPVVVPEPARDAAAPGALAREALLLPHPPTTARYALPPEVERGLGTIWRTCPVTGLELPVEAAHEAWFRRNSGTQAMLTPRELGVGIRADALANVAWAVLAAAGPAGEGVIRLLVDVGFRLDVSGPHGDYSTHLAHALAGRWQLGLGLAAAARSGACWLNPRCLRWVARELVAARCAGRRGDRHTVTFGPEEQLAMSGFFGHLGGGRRRPDELDVLMATWLLHSVYDGADGRDGDLLGMLSALSFAMPSPTGHIERFVTWADIWGVPDDHPLGVRLRWSGPKPSELRAAFRAEMNLSVEEWLAAALCALLNRWVRADPPRDLGFSGFSALLPNNQVAMTAAEALDAHLVTTLDELGLTVLEQEEERGGYRGIGTTSQTEWSPLQQRPVVRFADGTLMITSADAFARAAVTFPRALLESSGRVGDRRRIGGLLGRMFEAAGTDLLTLVADRCQVLDGAAVDQHVAAQDRRGDTVVADVHALVALEFSLQPLHPGAAAGQTNDVAKMLTRYAKKAGQAKATTSSPDIRAGLRRTGERTSGHFVVVDEPLVLTALHCARLRKAHPDQPDLFVIGMDDLARLVELAARGHSLPQALIAWQSGGSVLPFRHHLHKLERLTGVASERLATKMERLVRVIVDAPTAAAQPRPVAASAP